MVDLGSKHDFHYGPFEKYTKFMAHLKHFLPKQMVTFTPNKIYRYHIPSDLVNSPPKHFPKF